MTFLRHLSTRHNEWKQISLAGHFRKHQVSAALEVSAALDTAIVSKNTRLYLEMEMIWYLVSLFFVFLELLPGPYPQLVPVLLIWHPPQRSLYVSVETQNLLSQQELEMKKKNDWLSFGCLLCNVYRVTLA